MVTLHHIDASSGGIDFIKQLFSEYLSELDEDLQFQQVNQELEDPLKKYAPPSGSLILAYSEQEVAGCVALQALDEDGVCEMKRLYVRPEFREHGVGDQLVTAILNDAIELGYTKMVLDSLERLQPAIRLYQKHGFVPTTPYYTNPLPNVVFFEKQLED